ncbi:MAG TPA: Stf0 family sulfotransferase [Alphaproteobacteria bacterium]|nr:Stf0 family sulfotransferase [Alphaproteobacteria bacterium]
MQIPGTTPAAYFFGGLFRQKDNFGLTAYLAKRAREVRLVVPESAQGHLAHEIRCPIATLPEAFASGPSEPNLLVHVPQDERRVMGDLRRRYGSTRIVSLMHDILPVLSARGDPLADPIATPAAPASVRYAIVCPPRSGSTWLCEMLTRCGIGAPREHLRRSVIHLARCAWLRPIRYMSTVLVASARNGVFGTKLVSDLVADWRDTEQRLASLSRRLAAEGFAVVRLKRRDRVAQAVSFYFARRSRISHVRDPTRLSDIDRAQVGYDFRQIDAMHRFFVQQDELVDRFARSIAPSALLLDYEDVECDPAATVRMIASHIGIDAPSNPPRSNMIKISSQVAIMREYGERYRREAGLPPSS